MKTNQSYTPLVSVVITHFNRSDSLLRAISSASKQGSIVKEIIIVDDCSNEAERAEAARIVGCFHNAKIIFNKENSGPQRSRNTGIELSSADYIALLDCDDEWLEKKLEIQVSHLQSTGSNICACGFFKCLDNKARTEERKKKFTGSASNFILEQGGHLQTSTILGDIDSMKRVRFDPEVRKFQDWDFFIRAEAMNIKISYVEQRLSVYHFGATNQMTTSLNPRYLEEFLVRHRDRLNKNQYYRSLIRTLARVQVEAGDFKGAASTLVLTLKNGHFDLVGYLKIVRKLFLSIKSRQ